MLKLMKQLDLITILVTVKLTWIYLIKEVLLLPLIILDCYSRNISKQNFKNTYKTKSQINLFKILVLTILRLGISNDENYECCWRMVFSKNNSPIIFSSLFLNDICREIRDEVAKTPPFDKCEMKKNVLNCSKLMLN